MRVARPAVIPPTMLELAKGLDRVPTPADTLRLFMMPVRIPMARREAEMLEGAEPFQFENRGETIRGWTLGSGPPVVLVHGWNGRASQLALFAKELAENGRKAILFDAPAHGESGGVECNGLKVAECLHTLHERFGPISALLAHSFGAVGANVALWRGLRVERVVYIAGLVHIPQRFEEFGYACGLDDAGVQEYYDLAEAEFGEGILEQICGDAIAPKMSADALIVHDEEDAEIDIAQAESIATVWPCAKLVRTQNLGHRRIIRSQEIARLSTAFICGEQSRNGAQPPQSGVLGSS